MRRRQLCPAVITGEVAASTWGFWTVSGSLHPRPKPSTEQRVSAEKAAQKGMMNYLATKKAGSKAKKTPSRRLNVASLTDGIGHSIRQMSFEPSPAGRCYGTDLRVSDF